MEVGKGWRGAEGRDGDGRARDGRGGEAEEEKGRRRRRAPAFIIYRPTVMLSSLPFDVKMLTQ